MIGLVDCNNFYVSCERVFNPALCGKPVIILSNNDGCAISRSEEAKRLGIKMGVPAFSIQNLIERNDVQVLSSNYALYGDMSRRVMSLLSEYTPDIEIYSIDEAFLYFRGMTPKQLESNGMKILREVSGKTGIPLSIGLAATRTLAKVANKLAKRSGKGIFKLTENDRIEILKEFPVGDVWGIGRQHNTMLGKHGVSTAYDFIQLPGEWIRKNMSVVGLRIWEELHGNETIPAEWEVPAKKNICTSLSFGTMQSDLASLTEAVTAYASLCGEKLRKQKSCANTLMVFLHTNEFREDLPQYARNIVIHLPVATNSTFELVYFSKEGLRRIFKYGFLYKKAGVIVSDLVPEETVQHNLFDNTDRKKHSKLMQVMDRLNKGFGKSTVRMASQGFTHSWKLRQEKLSQRFTTRLSEVITVRSG